MTTGVSIDDVRNTSGATTDLIEDAKITDIITKAEVQVLSTFGIFCTPTKVLEIRDGNSKNTMMINRPFIWKLLSLEVNDAALDLENVDVEPFTSVVSIKNTETPYFYYNQRHKVRFKYLSALMEKSTTITESSAATVAGTSVAISVDDETGFAIDDWVYIEGLDGNREAAKITATDTNEITVDQLVQTHEADSIITKLIVDETLVQYVLYDACTNVANYIIGNTSNLPISFNIEGASAGIGVAYTHWKESSNRFIEKRDEMKVKLMNKLNVIA
jgi:hypothetical protein